MKIKYLGAARTVTGSCFILETAGHRFAIDCGMHQGNLEIEKRNWDTELYEPQKIEFVLLTHAHIDHSGLLPRLVQNGFRGPIFTTPPTADLLRILLLDSAYIQEMEAQWKSRKRLRFGEKRVGPLYTQRDAQAVFPLLKTVSHDQPFEPFAGVRVNFKDAGHILGSSFLELWLKENGAPAKFVFSGDIGRPRQLLMEDPGVTAEADYLFLESTYGNRDHKNEQASLDELAEAIAYSYNNNEKMVIPAFAVGRPQEMMYCLNLLSQEGRLPKDMPIYLDSPLAIQATEIFRRHATFLDDETQALILKGENPLRLPQLRCTQTTEESIAINQTEGPAIIISASGMAEAGRIRHHLKHNLWKPEAHVVIVGFQAQHTLGRRLLEGVESVTLFGDEIAVKAHIHEMTGLSAHADQQQLLDWASHFDQPRLVILTHGEPEAATALRGLLEERLRFKVAVANMNEVFDLAKTRRRRGAGGEQTE